MAAIIASIVSEFDASGVRKAQESFATLEGTTAKAEIGRAHV